MPKRRPLPPIFVQVCECFVYELGEDYASGEEWVRAVIAGVRNPDQRTELRAFLDSILGADLTDGELRAIHDRTATNLRFHSGPGARRFFTLMRDELARVNGKMRERTYGRAPDPPRRRHDKSPP